MQAAQHWARKFNVVPDLHPKDYLLHLHLTGGTFETVELAVKFYFEDGQKSAMHLYRLIYEELNYRNADIIKFLEFASGYGCVTRHLTNSFGSNVDTTACDIHKEAVEFISDKMKVKTLLSHSVPEKLQINAEYDIVFALSFFSHIPERTWGRWLQKLSYCVAKPGYLIFTTYGTESLKYFGNPEVSSSGFWFHPSSEQKDLDSAEYGTTVTTPKFVKKEIEDRTHSPIILFKEAFWWGLQDLYVVAKD